jgi:hypothetical protein
MQPDPDSTPPRIGSFSYTGEDTSIPNKHHTVQSSVPKGGGIKSMVHTLGFVVINSY